MCWNSKPAARGRSVEIGRIGAAISGIRGAEAQVGTDRVEELAVGRWNVGVRQVQDPGELLLEREHHRGDHVQDVDSMERRIAAERDRPAQHLVSHPDLRLDGRIVGAVDVGAAEHAPIIEGRAQAVDLLGGGRRPGHVMTRHPESM